LQHNEIMQTVIIGGSFNPMHIGHLFLAEEVLVQFACKRVIFVPSHSSAHKRDHTSVSPEERLFMVNLAVEGLDWITVDDCEIERGGVSYSIDTIRHFENTYSWKEKPGFVIGDDLVADFHHWKEYETLLNKVVIIVAHRMYKEKVNVPFPHHYIDNVLIPISSSEIRDRIREGNAYRFLLPEKVYEHIRANNLYVV
jgi:nicotinate-nucleotide adenylyltransferase